MLFFFNTLDLLLLEDRGASAEHPTLTLFGSEKKIGSEFKWLSHRNVSTH